MKVYPLAMLATIILLGGAIYGTVHNIYTAKNLIDPLGIAVYYILGFFLLGFTIFQRKIEQRG